MLSVSRVEFSWTNQRNLIYCYAMSKGKAKEQPRSEVLQGTLDLMILKTLDAMGPLHGYGIARRIEQLSEDVLQLNEGTVYTSLLRLQQQGWIGRAGAPRRTTARRSFTRLPRLDVSSSPKKKTKDWERISGVIGKVLQAARESH